jgi:hypothetical protein
VTTDEAPKVSQRAKDDQDARWYLTDERDFLLRSIEDADRELAAGDLTADDHGLLVARDQKRLGDVEAELAALQPVDHAPLPEVTPPAVPPRTMSWPRRVGILACCALIIVGVTILVVHATQTRLPGQASSGSITQSQAELVEQQLVAAQALESDSKTSVQALALYNKVLAVDPSDPEALAGAGWIEWTIGFDAQRTSIVRIGRQEVQRAVKVAPSYAQAHLYLGLILENQDANSRGAVAQFNLFLNDGPSAAEVRQVAPQVDGAYQAAGVPIPAALDIPTTTTTTTTSAP